MSSKADQHEALKRAVQAVEPRATKLPIGKEAFNREEAAKDPRNDVQLTFLKDHFDAIARTRAMAAKVRDEAYRHWQTADHALRLQDAELERIRDQVETRYAELSVDAPELYHARGCGCDVCDPFGERDEEHA